MMKIKGGEGPSMAQQTMQKALGGGGGAGAGGGPKKSWKDNLNPSAAQIMAKAEAANYKGPTYIQSKTGRNTDEDDQPNKDDKENKPKSTGDDDDDDDDDFLGGDDDQVLAALHAKRLNELRTTMGKTNEFKAMGHGEYTIIVQDEFLPTVTTSKYCIVHFFHPDFERCKVIDKHMAALATRHMATRFCSLNADKAPFFVTKLALKMLPTVICFKDGVAVDRIVGFDELGGTDEFTTQTFEKRLAKSGCLLSQNDNDDTHGSKWINKNNHIRKGVSRDDSDSEDD